MSTQSSEAISSRSRGWTKYADDVYDPIKVGSIDGKLEKVLELYTLCLTIRIFKAQTQNHTIEA